MRRRGLVGAVLLAALSSSCEGPAKRCGEGTVEHNGTCIVGDEGPRCGEGTVLDAASGACEPLTSCGDGTFLDEESGACVSTSACGPGTFLDLEERECVPEQECGPGTVADRERGVCWPTVVCGAGTMLDEESGECAPVEACADGSERDPSSGLCTSDLVCGPGQAVVDGICVPPGGELVLEADASESLPDDNDPEQGGRAEQLALESIGARTVFVGVIDRPADVAGNGTLVQDRDAWRFEGRAGQLLEIRVVGLGLPAPAFVLSGPNRYQRSSALGTSDDAEREVVLPFDGPYELVVAPSAFFSSGILLGDPAARYAGVIEELPFPSAPSLAAGNDATAPATAAGDLDDLTDNIFNLQAAAGTAMIVRIRAPDGDYAPAAIALSGTLDVLAHVQDITGGDGWMGVFNANEAHAVIVVDWQSASGPAGDYTLEAYKVPMIRRGDVPGDFYTVTSAHALVPGNDGCAFQVAIDDPQVIVAEVDGSGVFGPDLQVIGPGGTRARVDDRDEVFFYADAGEYILFSYNDATSDDTNVSVTLELSTPHDLGILEPGALSAAATGGDLAYGVSGFGQAWAVVGAVPPGLLRFDLAAVAGDPVIEVHRVSGPFVRSVRRAQLGRPFFVRVQDDERLLLRIDSDGQNLVDWTLGATLDPPPALLDAEPNDGRQTAVPLGPLPLSVVGTLDDDEVDVFRFELDEPLASGQAVRITVDHLESSGFGFTTGGGRVFVRGPDFAPLPSQPSTDDDAGVGGKTAATYVPHYEGAGPFYVEVSAATLSAPMPYALELRVVEVEVEVEPNDLAGGADVLPALPAAVVAYRDPGDLPDLFRIDLAADLGFDESLIVEASNGETNNRLSLSLESAAGEVLASHEAVLAGVALAGPPAGSYYVRVTGASYSAALYLLSARLGERAELEPNDTPLLAQELGAIALSSSSTLELRGAVNGSDADLFRFTLAEPLPEGGGLDLEALNLDDSSDIGVQLFAGEPSDASASLLAWDDDPGAFLVVGAGASTGPFTLRIAGEGTMPDRYRVRLREALAAEQEPNGGEATATALPLPADLEGTIGAGDVDVLRFTTASSGTLRFLLENRTSDAGVRLSLRRGSFGNEIESIEGFRVQTSKSFSAGNHYVVVTSARAAGDAATDVYRLEVEAP